MPGPGLAWLSFRRPLLAMWSTTTTSIWERKLCRNGLLMAPAVLGFMGRIAILAPTELSQVWVSGASAVF